MRIAKYSSIRRIFGLIVMLSFLTHYGVCQNPSTSADGLIKFITYQSNRSNRSPSRVIHVTCGIEVPDGASEDRNAAQSLAKLGGSAVQELDKAFDSIELHGAHSPYATNARWLLDAYARIEGRRGLGRLVRMAENDSLDFLQNDLDNAVALCLGLTSYVSGTRKPVGFRCAGDQPRDALDQLIQAWEQNDRSSVEGSLGPKAEAALQALLRGSTWARMRKDIGAVPSSQWGVGYKLDIAGPWSEPEDLLKESPPSAVTQYERKSVIDVTFTTRSGTVCASDRVEFSYVGFSGAGHPAYVVDNDNIGSLLQSLQLCAARRD